MNFIEDKEISFRGEDDCLQLNQYADVLKSTIESSPQNETFTIGLFGKWGVGKSSIVKTVQDTCKSKKIRFVKYDAWQYVNDSFRRMFLRTLRSELRYEETELMQSFYANESRKIKTEYKFSFRGSIYVVLMLLLCVVVLQFVDIDPNEKTTLSVILSSAGTIVSLCARMFDKIDVSLSKPHLFAPEQFENCYTEMIEACFQKENPVAGTFRYIMGDKGIKNLEKLVIVVDNIDRCQGDVAYSLLSDIKTFLGKTNKNVVFVIPVDEDALKNQVFCKDKSGEGNKEKEEFLRKLFNVVIRVEPYSETDMFAFAQKLNTKYNCNFNPETLYLASREYSQNPRRIIQLFNNLTAELEFYAKDNMKAEGELYQTAIGACLIMKEEYHELYEKAVASPLILVKQFADNDLKDKYEPFMVHARPIFARVNADVGALYKVVKHGYSKYDELDEKFKQSVLNKVFSQIIEMMKDTKKRNLQMHYICDLLKTVVNGRVRSEVTWFFGLISKMYVNDLLNETNKRQFSSLFEQFGYEEFLPDVCDLREDDGKSYHDCCRYIEFLRDEKQNKASNFLFDYFKSFEKDMSDLNREYFTTFICFSKNISDVDAEVFSTMINSVDIPLRLCVNFDGEHFNRLVSDYAIEQGINRIEGFESYNELLPVLKNIFALKTNLCSSTCSTFWKRMLYCLQNADVKTPDSDFRCLKDLNKLLPSMKTSSQRDVVRDGFIQSMLTILSSNTSSRIGNRIALISRIAGDVQKENTIYKFLYEAFRVTGGIDINQELAALRQNNALMNFRPYIVDLVEKDKININIIWMNVKYVVSDFKDESNTKILKHLVDNKISYSEIQGCISSIFDNVGLAFNEQFIIDLCSNGEYKTQVINDLTRRSADFINGLPVSILPFVVNAFNDDNKGTYRDNYEYLKVVVAKGDDSQKRSVKRMVVERINDNEVNLELILLIKNAAFNSDNKNEIIFALKDFRKNSKTMTPEVKQAIDELVGEGT